MNSGEARQRAEGTGGTSRVETEDCYVLGKMRPEEQWKWKTHERNPRVGKRSKSGIDLYRGEVKGVLWRGVSEGQFGVDRWKQRGRCYSMVYQ